MFGLDVAGHKRGTDTSMMKELARKEHNLRMLDSELDRRCESQCCVVTFDRMTLYYKFNTLYCLKAFNSNRERKSAAASRHGAQGADEQAGVPRGGDHEASAGHRVSRANPRRQNQVGD